MDPIDHDTCATILGMLDGWLDRELAPDEICRVERHLATCAVCASEFRFEDKVMRQLRAKVQRIAVPPGLLARVWKRVTSGVPG